MAAVIRNEAAEGPCSKLLGSPLDRGLAGGGLAVERCLASTPEKALDGVKKSGAALRCGVTCKVASAPIPTKLGSPWPLEGFSSAERVGLS